MLRVYEDAVLVPYAVEVDGQIISLYDPAVHQRVKEDDEERNPRWWCATAPA
jgi:hypothetical protein